LSDSSNLIRILSEVRPDEVYNLGAQSHVAVSFELPEYTADVDGLGCLRLLEAIRFLGLTETRYYQASSSELFGKVVETPQSETTPFYPRSPYGVAKLFAYWITINYREAYGMYACDGILFNHESPKRGETFVTRKITRALTNIALGLEDCLYIGNLNAKRDWGHARDYVEMQWLMLQQTEPADYVIATGEQISVRNFIERASQQLGLSIAWSGSALDEIGTIEAIWATDRGEMTNGLAVGDVIVRVDTRYFRPAEVETLLGNPGKAARELGWRPTSTIDDLIAEMLDYDLDLARQRALLSQSGFTVRTPAE
jgi:GDPmannose 4,6-dehydratase